MTGTANDDEMFLSTIRRMNAETGKLVEEQSKFVAEQHKLLAEERKHYVEAERFGREHLMRVVSGTAAVSLGVVAIGGLIVKIIGW